MLRVMTSTRTVAYRRVMRTLRGVDAPALSAVEQERVREAADALLFCCDFDDADVRWALADVAVLRDELVGAGRWTPRRVQQLLDDICACGPDLAARVPTASKAA
jgi:hypothetical protein